MVSFIDKFLGIYPIKLFNEHNKAQQALCINVLQAFLYQ